jgi:hypothetical protein
MNNYKQQIPTKLENSSHNYVEWQKTPVPIPLSSYNAGGKLTPYNKDSTLEYLNNLQRWIDAGNLKEVLGQFSEEYEDGHEKYLTNIVLGKNLAENPEKLEKVSHFPRIKGLIAKLDIDKKLSA